MNTHILKRRSLSALGLFLAVSLLGAGSRQIVGQRQAISIDADDIGGVVTGARSPEAGVWVIAETTNLPTKFSRIVVTDDQGRYLVPDLPRATYNVWVRGYGLVDSAKVQTAPGTILNLTAAAAPNASVAAAYYPAQYWFSLLRLPPAVDFPGTGATGNGMSPTIKTQGQWVQQVLGADGCTNCHQLGNKATRTLPTNLGAFDSSASAWERRVQSGPDGGKMWAMINGVGKPRAIGVYSDWTDGIAAGALPNAPPRPEDIERNVVISMWDWADPRTYLHDEIASDKRNPRVNANGPIYGALEESADYVPIVDPVRNFVTNLKLEVRDSRTPTTGASTPLAASPYWGDEQYWHSQANAHSFAMDSRARVWIAARIRPGPTAPFCRAGSVHPSAKAFPINQSGRQMAMYDPNGKRLTTIDLCFGTHHLNFAEDAKNMLWFSGGGAVVGWFDTKLFDETGDEAKAQGWTVLVLDTNGNGKRDSYVEPNQPLDPTRDKRIEAPFYAVAPSPLDDSIWGSSTGYPGSFVRLVPGKNPPETALAEIYEFPWKDATAPAMGYRAYAPRGMDVDRYGVVWAGTSSGDLVSFDRRKCKGPLNGPKATGQQCPEGWTIYPLPGPNFKNASEVGSADSPYYTFVDRFNMLGVGNNVPMITGNESEALVAMVDGRFWTFRVPYPLGYYSKGFDGRIDDPNAGWKGKAVYSTFATRTPFHLEGGKGTTSKVVKFQVRPNALAK